MFIINISYFREFPRKGHLNILKLVCGYLFVTIDEEIVFRIYTPEYSSIPDIKFYWTRTVYGEVNSNIPSNIHNKGVNQ